MINISLETKEKGRQIKLVVFFFPTLKTRFRMEYLTRKMDTIRIFFPNSSHFLRFSKKCRGIPPYLSSCAPDKIVFRNCSSTSSYLFSACRKDSFIFVLQILAISNEIAIGTSSNNLSIQQEAVLCSNCCALSILPYYFSNFPIIMHFDFFISSAYS